MIIDKYVAQNKEVAYRIIEDEAVILTPEDGMLHNLNPTGTRVFALANGKRKARDIINCITDEFEVAEATAAKDVVSFIKGLTDKKMLFVSDKPVKKPKR